MRRQACSYNTAYRAMCGSDHDTAVSLSKTATTQLLPLALLYGKEVFLTNWLRFSILVTFLSSFFLSFFFFQSPTAYFSFVNSHCQTVDAIVGNQAFGHGTT